MYCSQVAAPGQSFIQAQLLNLNQRMVQAELKLGQLPNQVPQVCVPTYEFGTNKFLGNMSVPFGTQLD